MLFDVEILPRMPSEGTIFVLISKNLLGEPATPTPMGGVNPSHTQ